MRTGHTQSQSTHLRTDLAQTVRMLPVRSAPPADDRTAIVEGYRPPVPPARPRS